VKKYSKAKYIVIFVLIQLSWLAVLGLWIARYVSNHMTLKEIDQRYAIHISSGENIAILVIGLTLIVISTIGMWVLFRYLNFHFHQTRLYDNFIASITHELKTPLASIRIYLETLNSYRDISEKELREFIDKMSVETTRLHKMINSILEAGRLENRRTPHNCQLVDANDTLLRIWEDLRNQYHLTEHQLRITGNSVSRAVFDINKIRLMFDNLMDNSIKYTVNEPNIEIRLSDSDKYISIRYRDHGQGVSPSQLRKIFKKFHRAYDPNHPDVKGTGLGLYLVKGIINFHGGRIKAGIPKNKIGLQFHIKIPRYPHCKKRYLEKLLNPKP